MKNFTLKKLLKKFKKFKNEKIEKSLNEFELLWF